MINYQYELNRLLQKAMSRSEAASLAGKASAEARKKRAAGGSGQTTDFNEASAKANRLIAANPGKFGPKTKKPKGAGKAKAKKGPDPAKAKEKAAKQAEREKTKAEHLAAQKEKAQEREKTKAEHVAAAAQKKQELAAKQAERQKVQAEKQKQMQAKQKQAEKQRSSAQKQRASAQSAREAARNEAQQEKQQRAANLNTAAATRVASALASGGKVSTSDANRLIEQGLAVQKPDGGLEFTDTGQNLLPKADTFVDLAKATEAASLLWSGWAQITKVDEEQRIVYGIASTEIPDNEPGIWKGEAYAGDIISSDAMRKAAPGYLEFPAIREMHQPIAAGTAIHFEIDGNTTWIGAHIVDDQAWAKVVNKVYRGFSIGGRCKGAEIIKLEGRPYRRVTELDLTEISLVDRPRNPDAKITLYKGVNTVEDPTEVVTQTATTDSAVIAKAADPTKAIAMLQQLRNDAETAGDMDAADLYTQAIRNVAQGAGIAAAPEDDEDSDPSDDMTTDADLAQMEDVNEGADNVEMSDNKTDIKKIGAALSSANMAHAKTAHDALHKMTGGAVCGPQAGQPRQQADGLAMSQMLAPDDIAKAFKPAFDGIAKLLEQNGLEVASLKAEVEKLKSQPAPGAPAVRGVAVEKTIAGGAVGGTTQPAEDPRETELKILKAQRDQTSDPTVLKFLSDQIVTKEIAMGYIQKRG